MERQFLLNMYRDMLLIRRAEERISELALNGEINSLVHLSMGQEACAVGMCGPLLRDDYVWSTHRCHAHYLAKGGSLPRMFAELAGRKDGCALGRGGSMHLVDPNAGFMGTSAIVGESIALAAGSALASKMRKDSRVSVAFFGDGAVEQGVFWETLNFAVVHKLPLILFCENNLYATHSHISQRQPSSDITSRVWSFRKSDQWCLRIDGNSIIDIEEAARWAVKRARRGAGPIFIEALTYRWKEHWGPGDDADLGYRTKDEIDFWKMRCPIASFRNYIISRYGCEAEMEAIEKCVRGRVEAAWEFARNCPYPESAEIMSSPERLETSQAQEKIYPDEPIDVLDKSTWREKMFHGRTYKEAIADAFVQAIENDKRVFLMGEGVDGVTGVYGTTLPAFREFGSERVIDTPLSESAITGIAIGASVVGMKPVIMHQRNGFIMLALSQIADVASNWRNVTGGRLKAPVIIFSYIAKKPGEGPQHTYSLQSVFGHFPGLKVVMPSNPVNAKGLILSAIREENDPVLVLAHRSLNENAGSIYKGLYYLPIGKGEIKEWRVDFFMQGLTVTIVAVSEMADRAIIAANYLSSRCGIYVELIDLLSARPLDRRLVVESLERTGRLVIADTGWPTYGLSAEIAAIAAEELGPRLKAPVIRVGMAEMPAPASQALEQHYHPDADKIIEAVKRVCRYDSS